ncbi:RDD family protein [Streptomyces sp. NPDC004539]|uniref:RDD family protein n=1 Tax=Streptomyces sp. NPDC004539 TaxID=3154280 RepID=UPI0033B48E22
MSAPTPAPGDDRPREGYYPDPSIPGYVRYWNGAAWVPGTSRPAPSDGRPLTPPPGAPARPVPAVEETGPHFFDEDPVPAEPASAWAADAARQSGFGGDQDRRVSWGSPQTPDPRAPRDPRAPERPAGPGASAEPPAGHASGPDGDHGTVTFRAPGPRTGEQSGGTAPAKPGFGAGKAAAARAAAQGTGSGVGGAGAGGSGGAGTTGSTGGTTTSRPGGAASAPPSTPNTSGAPGAIGAPGVQGTPAPSRPPGITVPAPAFLDRPDDSPPPAAAPGQHSWAQQVHQLAADDQPQAVTPWRPPVEDVFQAAARRQASARPAGLGKRFAARLVDTLVLAAVTGAAAVPLGTKALDHVNAKIDEAKLSGRTVTVWLLDGTTAGYLGIVLAVLLLFGVLYEALPTARWGRTLGKKLCGLEVRDIEGGEPPSFGAALRRWLVYSVPGLLVVGVVGVLWCVFDKPWRQCWHDKAAHTFVAG